MSSCEKAHFRVNPPLMLPRVIPRKIGTRERAVLRCGARSFVLRSWLGAKTAKNGSQRPGSWLGARQDDVRGLSFRNAPFVSSRSAPIRDLALALSKERRCRIKSGMTGRDCHPVVLTLMSSRNGSIQSSPTPIRDPPLRKP